MMIYCDVWLRGIKGIFSWHATGSVLPGARVRVPFRGRARWGIVVRVFSEKPSFSTRSLTEVVDEQFLSEETIALAHTWAQRYFSSLEKILSLMVPEKFLQQEDPVERDVFYRLVSGKETDSVRGTKQQWVLDTLQKEGRTDQSVLREKASLSTLRSLEDKGLIHREEGAIKTTVRWPRFERPEYDLTPAQEKALEQILSETRPTVLFGVTGSGKTEVYKKLAQNILEKDPDGQVLLLLPEIALTPQLVAEFCAIFGERLALWHSNLSEGEKVQEWAKMHSGQARVVIGARSAALLPLPNPRLCIMDEEHEWTYKNEFAPRFWAHDILEDIGKIFGAKLVVGSATPRLESWKNVDDGVWNLVRLDRRVQETLLPETRFIDLRNEAKKGNYGPFSEALLEELEATFASGKQAILFLNKRGYSGATMCKKCGKTFECPHCSQPMKMHQKGPRQKFICHVCGHMEQFPQECPECQAKDFQFRGWGTQMVEEVLAEHFPKIRTMRADSDTITGKHDFSDLLEAFYAHKADVLLGTQMIAKGLDFEKVQLVGIILADVGLNLPDFRSDERVFQLLTQVSGRAGRRAHRGKIIIQTFRPEEKVFEYVKHHDAEGFLTWQENIRQEGLMPPFASFAKLTFSHRIKTEAFMQAQNIYKQIKKTVPPETPWSIHFVPAFFPRSHGKYHFHVVIRGPSREELWQFLDRTNLPERTRIDLDPVSLL